MNVTMGRMNQKKILRFKIALMEACVRSGVYVRGCPVRKISGGTSTTWPTFSWFFSLPPNKHWNKFLQYTTSAPSHSFSNSLFILLSHSTLQSLRNDRVYKLRTNTHTSLEIATAPPRQVVIPLFNKRLYKRASTKCCHSRPWHVKGTSSMNQAKVAVTLKFASVWFKSDCWKAFHNRHILTQM